MKNYRALDLPAPERRTIENPTVPVSAANFMEFFGLTASNLPTPTLDNALRVPAVAAAVSFLSTSMANLPIHVRRETGERTGGALQRLLNEAPNPEWTSFGWRKYMWTQVFTGGRGVSWIERDGARIVAIWPMDPRKTQVKRQGGRKVYIFDGNKTYPAADVIDVPFLLKPDQLGAYGPVALGAKAITLALALGDYAAQFFANGGVPPLALYAPAASPGAMRRGADDVMEAVKSANAEGRPVLYMPTGTELKPIGFEPDKGQLTEARRLQVEEIARVYNLPPIFLQDLSRATFTNSEQQDLHLVKHVIAGWAKALEEELNLKIMGRTRYAEHGLDALLRGDMKSRMEAHAQAIQNAIRTPDEVRALENLPAMGGDASRLLVQGATVPLDGHVELAASNDPQEPPVNAQA